MATIPSIKVQAYEFHFNLAVYPLPATAVKMVNKAQSQNWYLTFLL